MLIPLLPRPLSFSVIDWLLKPMSLNPGPVSVITLATSEEKCRRWLDARSGGGRSLVLLLARAFDMVEERNDSE